MASLNNVDCNFLVGIVTASVEWNILWHERLKEEKVKNLFGVCVVSFYFGVGVDLLLFPNPPPPQTRDSIR